MADATATLSNYRQAPRKVRLVADLIRGKSVTRALMILQTLPKRAAEPVEKLLRSAIANAGTKGIPAEDLVVGAIAVNAGIVFKRSMPRARGRASAIHKRSSLITLALKKKN